MWKKRNIEKKLKWRIRIALLFFSFAPHSKNKTNIVFPTTTMTYFNWLYYDYENKEPNKELIWLFSIKPLLLYWIFKGVLQRGNLRIFLRVIFYVKSIWGF